jgi:hypothetical protein
MAQELRSINLVAPAFKGVNTEDSPIAQDPSFAEIADNAIIDKRGRIAARKGYVVNTTDRSEILDLSVTPNVYRPIRTIKEFRDNQGNNKIFSVGNNKILSGTTTLVDETPVGYTITEDNWKIVNFNDKAYFFQRGYEPLVYDSAGGAVVPLSTVSGAAGITSNIYGNEVLSAYGRLWTADFGGNKSTIYWSDLLIGHNWSGGTSGSIDISKVWPDGYDEIVALAAHNGLLVIFGQHSIVVYQGAQSPATMSLADTVAGVGCVDRDTVQHTGTDVLFLSHTGLRSFGRTIQQKSMPLQTLSKTITKDLIALIQNESSFFRSVYSPEENFYLLTFVGQLTTFCFDLRGSLEDGSLRVTRWPSSIFTSYERRQSGTLFVGSSKGISTYTGFQDDGASYRFKYYSPSLTFGDPSKLKFIKKIKPTVVGASGEIASIKYAYDFKESYQSVTFNVPNVATSSEYNVAEFNIDEYSESTQSATQKRLNATGSGTTVVVGLEADIDGFSLSLQEINILALIGKTV